MVDTPTTHEMIRKAIQSVVDATDFDQREWQDLPVTFTVEQVLGLATALAGLHSRVEALEERMSDAESSSDDSASHGTGEG